MDKKSISTIVVTLIIGLCVGFFVGQLYASHQRRAALQMEYYRHLNPKISRPQEPIIWRGFTKKKVVALTFDDGPNPRYTPRILKILKEHHIVATFFVVGCEAKQHPNLIRQEVKNGNQVENHSWNHPEFELLSEGEMRSELEKTAKIIKKLTGRRPHYFRSPHGVLTGRVYLVANNEGYKLVLWSNELRENRFKSPKEDARYTTRLVGTGGIILAHDGRSDHERGIKALPYLIKCLKKRGYRFVTINKLPYPKNVPRKET